MNKIFQSKKGQYAAERLIMELNDTLGVEGYGLVAWYYHNKEKAQKQFDDLICNHLKSFINNVNFDSISYEIDLSFLGKFLSKCDDEPYDIFIDIFLKYYIDNMTTEEIAEKSNIKGLSQTIVFFIIQIIFGFFESYIESNPDKWDLQKATMKFKEILNEENKEKIYDILLGKLTQEEFEEFIENAEIATSNEYIELEPYVFEDLELYSNFLKELINTTSEKEGKPLSEELEEKLENLDNLDYVEKCIDEREYFDNIYEFICSGRIIVLV